MKIQGVPGNSLMCVQTRTRAREHSRYQGCRHTLLYMLTYLLYHCNTHTHTHLFAWWTFIRMQSGGIMWFKQSRGWQTRSPAELKISPNTLRDQIIGPYVDLAQSSHTCVCVCICSVYMCVCEQICDMFAHMSSIKQTCCSVWITGGGLWQQ